MSKRKYLRPRFGLHMYEDLPLPPGIEANFEQDLFTPTIYWPMVESSLGIVGACLPLLKPVVSDFPVIQSFRSILSSRSTSRASSQNLLKEQRKLEEGMSKSTLASSEVSTYSTAKTSM